MEILATEPKGTFIFTFRMEYLGYLIRNNISICTFDFSGCGNSEGDYISLGYYEQQDLN